MNEAAVSKTIVFMGVCIDTAPLRGIMSFQWSFAKANSPTINPLKGNSVCLPCVKWFHYAFCNTMTMEETQKEYDRYVVPESRNIPRSTLGKAGRIDFKNPMRPCPSSPERRTTSFPPRSTGRISRPTSPAG